MEKETKKTVDREVSEEKKEYLDELENKELPWSISAVWNRELILGREEWKRKPREYIRSSELGGSFLTRFLRMKGIPDSNPPDARTLRKFEAGNLFEWLVGQVLRKAGLITPTQGKVTVRIPNLLPVYGRYDYLVKPPENWDAARKNVRSIEYPENLEKIALKLVDYLQEKLPIVYGASGQQVIGMQEKIYEVKSVNSMVFWSHIEQIRKGYLHHRLQTYSYLVGSGIAEGRLFYISKDDLTTVESQVLLEDETTKGEFLADIEKMTVYLKTNTQPEKDDDLEFNPEKNRWNLNWKVRYSPFLTRVTGQTREAWEYQWNKERRKRNSQLKDGEMLVGKEKKLAEDVSDGERKKLTKEIEKIKKRMAKREGGGDVKEGKEECAVEKE